MQPKDVIVSEDGTVVLNVVARGTGRKSFTYEWKKVGSDSLPDTASGGNSTELTITSVTSSDSGLYYCIVMNTKGEMVKSYNATVNVLCKLVFYTRFIALVIVRHLIKATSRYKCLSMR